MILMLALVCGLLGLAIHIFLLASIVFMSVALGLIAAEVRGRGVLPELVAEAKHVAAEITGPDASSE